MQVEQDRLRCTQKNIPHSRRDENLETNGASSYHGGNGFARADKPTGRCVAPDYRNSENTRQCRLAA